MPSLMLSTLDTAERIAEIGASFPTPSYPQANSPVTGSIKVTPRSDNTLRFSIVAECSYIFPFMAGAINTGALVAK